MPSPRRIEKLNNLLCEELADILERDIEFPDSTLVTVTRVVISPDGHYASAMISVIGQAEPFAALAILEKNIYHIQQAVNRRMRTRPVPKITFRIDEEEERRERVEESLAQLRKKEELQGKLAW